MKMDNTINGRTPEEIKKGLGCCQTDMTTKYKVCGSCAYFNDGFGCENKLLRDALEYIQQLERERDVAVEDCIVAGEDYADLYWETKRMEAAAPKWISAKERLPYEDETVIVCADDGCVYAAQYWGHEMWRRELIGCAKSDTDVTPTHWMPLPEPPEEEA